MQADWEWASEGEPKGAKLSRGDGVGTPLTRTGVCQYAEKVGALRQAGWHRRNDLLLSQHCDAWGGFLF